MKSSKLIVLFLVFAMMLIGIHCKSTSEPTDDGLSTFVGTWAANSDIEGTLMEYDATDVNPAFKVDVLLLGASVQVTLESDGDYILTLTEPGGEPEIEQGTATVDGNQITMIPDGAPEEAIIFTYTLNEPFLTLVADDVTFDFGAGDVPATLTITMKRVTD
ncbi:MAG: hypothetical protein KAV45_13360 [Calditrichia bacterium]|nr:hypothetical protein [Calditrichia bacterium]